MASNRMPCPYCGKGNTKNIWTRRSKKLGTVKRSKMCLECNSGFYTMEMSLQDYKIKSRALSFVKKVFSAFGTLDAGGRSLYEQIRQITDTHKEG